MIRCRYTIVSHGSILCNLCLLSDFSQVYTMSNTEEQLDDLHSDFSQVYTMSNTEEQLDDLHKSILSLCAGDITVINTKNTPSDNGNVLDGKSENEEIPKTTKPIVKDKQDESCSFIPQIVNFSTIPYAKQVVTELDGGVMASFKSEISNVQYLSDKPTGLSTVSYSDFVTIDEVSCSDTDSSTTVSEVSSCSPIRSDSSGLYHTVDETINTPKLKGEKLSPIKDIGNDSSLIVSAPGTPSVLGSKFHNCDNDFSCFAQSTPLQTSKGVVTNNRIKAEDLSIIIEKDESMEEMITGKRVKSKHAKSMFTMVESDFSDMSFDDLLLDTFVMCKGKDFDWSILYGEKTKMLHPQEDLTLNETVLHSNADVTKKETENLNLESNDIKSDEFVGKKCENKEKLGTTSVVQSNTEFKLLKRIGEINDMLKEIDNSKTVEKKGHPSTSKTEDQNEGQTKAENQNISKIKIDSFFTEKAMPQKDENQKTRGRFFNFTSSFLSDIEVTEDESEVDISEDVLGLNSFTYNEADDIDLDAEDEATLLDETILDLPESIKNKYKLQEQISILSKADTTVVDGNKIIVDDQQALESTDVNRNVTKLISETEEELKSMGDNLNQVETGEQMIPVKVMNQVDMVQVKVKEEDKITTEDEGKSTEHIKNITGKIDYEAERKYFKVESREVKDIIKQWGSQGIQDPEINLSYGTNIRVKNRKKKGLLEGSHISCIWLQESVNVEKNWSSPLKKKQKLDNEAHTRRDILILEQELEDVKFRFDESIKGLFQEWLYEKQSMEDGNRRMFQNLNMRQLMEMKENYFRFRNSNVPLYQMNVVRLHSEHGQQKAEFKSRFNSEMEKLRHIFQRREVDIERNFNHRKGQLKSLIDQIQHVKSDGKYGHHVTAQFVKGPCRSNNLTKSLVEVYVPADVASCILKEDEIVDSFYKYT